MGVYKVISKDKLFFGGEKSNKIIVFKGNLIIKMIASKASLY